MITFADISPTIAKLLRLLASDKDGELLPRAFDDPTDWRCRICRCWGMRGGGDGKA
jgi:hypothetical protein